MNFALEAADWLGAGCSIWMDSLEDTIIQDLSSMWPGRIPEQKGKWSVFSSFRFVGMTYCWEALCLLGLLGCTTSYLTLPRSLLPVCCLVVRFWKCLLICIYTYRVHSGWVGPRCWAQRWQWLSQVSPQKLVKWKGTLPLSRDSYFWPPLALNLPSDLTFLSCCFWCATDSSVPYHQGAYLDIQDSTLLSLVTYSVLKDREITVWKLTLVLARKRQSGQNGWTCPCERSWWKHWDKSGFCERPTPVCRTNGKTKQNKIKIQDC